MTKKENIQNDINNIDQKIKKLNAQKNLLLIQLESIKENPVQPTSRSTEDRGNGIRTSSIFPK